MIPTEQLNVLWLNLTEQPTMVERLRHELTRLTQSPAYQCWHKSNPRKPFELESRGDDDSNDLLAELGLRTGRQLNVKVNRMGRRIFVTDGAWVANVMRVFPDADESETLVSYVAENGLDAWADVVVDPAAGCGHTPIGFVGHARRIAMDANARAIVLEKINALLNGFDQDRLTTVVNDMRSGFPTTLKVGGNVLFLANVPFAPAPGKPGRVALNAHGGETGGDLQLAAFRFVRSFQKVHSQPVKACFLTWTLGNRKNNFWEAVERCKRIFPERDVRWCLIDDGYDNGDMPNPAPIEMALNHMATSQYVVESDDPNEDLQEQYRTLASDLMKKHYTDAAYGMIEI